MAEEMTTQQLSKKASKKLEELAEAYKRSKVAQIEWLIERDYEKLEQWKLVGKKDSKKIEPEQVKA